MRIFNQVVFLLVVSLASIQVALAVEPCDGYWSNFLVVGTSGSGITSIESAPDGRLFAGGKNGGLMTFARRPDGLYQWSVIAGTARDPLASPRVSVLARQGNQLWIGTENAGVSRLGLDTGAWTQFRAANPGLPSNIINSITVRHGVTNTQVWFGTSNGAVFLEAGRLMRWTRVGAAQGIQAGIRDVAVRQSGDNIVHLIATTQHLYRWDGSSATLVTNTGDCRFATASKMVLDDSSRVWFAALWRPVDTPSVLPDGLCSWRPNLFGSSWVDYPEATALNGIFLEDLSIDDGNRLWIAGRGIAAVRDAGSYCFWDSDSSPLFSDDLAAVHAVNEAAWFGYRTSRFLARYVPNWAAWTSNDLGTPGRSPSAVAAQDGAIWVGHGTSVSVSTNGANWSRVILNGISDAISGLAVESSASVWVATSGDGVVHVQGASQTRFRAAEGLPSDDIRDIALGDGGQVWVATAGGLAVMGTGGYFLPIDSNNSPLETNDLSSVTVTPDGVVWIGASNDGVYAFDTSELEPDAAWRHITTAQGLPSNAVNDVTADTVEGVWIGSDGGLTHLAGSSLITHDVASGALPDDRVLDVSADGAGRVWVGTDGGLAVGEADTWRTFRVTGSALGSDRVAGVAASAESVFVAAGTLSRRDPITGPIGFFPPRIDSIAPPSQSPTQLVTISGANFDSRGPEYNIVTFGPRDAATNNLPTPAEVVSVTSSQLVVKVPVRATSGRIRITTHGLTDVSDSDFLVLPEIRSLFNDCLGPGEELGVEGFGFRSVTGGQFPQLRIGNGPWRTPNRAGPNNLWYFVHADDPNGRVTVRLSNGLQDVSAPDQTVDIGRLSVTDVDVQQAIASEILIWRKRTLIHVDIGATGCDASVSGGTVYWKKNGGELIRAGIAYLSTPGGQSVPLEQSETLGLAEGVDFIAEFLTGRSAYVDPFPLSQFDGLRLVLENNGIEVVTHDVPASAFDYVDMGHPSLRIHLRALRHVSDAVATPESEFWKRIAQGMEHTARMLPQPDTGLRYSSQSWFTISSGRIPRDSLDLDDLDVYLDFVEANDDYLDPDPNEIAIVVLDEALYVDGAPARAPPYGLGSVGVAFCRENLLGRYIAHEGGHGLGLVVAAATNHDSANKAHSRYDEGQGEDLECADATDLTFRQALVDQAGIVSTVYRIDSGAPFRGAAGFCDDDRPRSLMSYAPGRNDFNSFYEPIDYAILRNVVASLAANGFAAGGSTLRLRGTAFLDGRVAVNSSRIEEPGGPPSLEIEGGSYSLMLRDAANTILVSHPFDVPFEDPGGAGLMPRSRFSLRVPFPEETKSAEIRRQGALRWSAQVSNNAPTIDSFLLGANPIDSGESVEVSWSASDPDGGTLIFCIDYSPDGLEWIPVARGLTGEQFTWEPGFVPTGRGARLRLLVSDGFHTATAESDTFQLFARDPVVSIVRPRPDEVFGEGTRIDLVAALLSNDDENGLDLRWSIDSGGRIDNGPQSTHVLEKIGAHTITVTLSGRGGRVTASDEITVIVVADFDRDGMPNDWEKQHGLNRFVLADAFLDSDGDRLANVTEFRRGTDPNDADSDDDGFSDGDEVELGSQPNDSSSVPPKILDASFRRGDANDDGQVDISDGIRIIGHLFLGADPFTCDDAADANDDGSRDVSDAITIFGFLFLGGSPPPAPGALICGTDPTADGLGCAEAACP